MPLKFRNCSFLELLHFLGFILYTCTQLVLRDELTVFYLLKGTKKLEEFRGQVQPVPTSADTSHPLLVTHHEVSGCT
jgi:hypothetical protein